MKARIVAAAAIAIAAALGSAPAGATHQDAQVAYERPGRVEIGGVVSGGFSSTSFDVPFSVNSVKVTDAVGGWVGVSFCQDGGDSVCGQQAPGTDPDIVFNACVQSGKWVDLPQAFAANVSTTIFINAVSLNTGNNCDGQVGSVGTVDLRRTH